MARISTSTVVLQPLAVAGGSYVDNYDASDELLTDAAGNKYINYVLPNANVSVPIVTTVASTESQLLRMTLSSVPLVFRSEITDEYAELGHALAEMTRLDEGDEWKIDTVVYQVACQLAVELSALSYPAPQVFSHGPKSVVFNWSQEPNNLYLTISSDFISALASTPERIKRRIEFSTKQLLDPTLVFRALLPWPSEQPVFSARNVASQVEEITE